jgi:mono/diheme cytochrome c family protein
MNKRVYWILLVVMVGLLAACGAGNTARQQQISSGKRVYLAYCVGCHGSDLEGRFEYPPLTRTTLGSFGNAARLFDFISTRMPLVAQGYTAQPGTLGTDKYYSVEAYILDYVGFLPAGQTLDAQTAPNITWTLGTAHVVVR